ncbi:MAG: restriction endonuclease [Alphaproteobacteria bacterium]|nr:restriction endonuclease [Alphaproteobacteria bacterium]MDA8031861.1 restriction endonuclease [Alphaproteobacteria bacterium]
MTSKNAWAVRPYPHGIDRAEEFLKNSMVAIGWPKLGDLTGCGKEKIREKFKAEYPADNPYSVGQQVGIIDRFVNQIHEGSIIAVPYGGDVFFGVVSKKYSFHKEFAGEDEGYAHWIGVDYKFGGDPIPRGQLPETLFASLKGQQSVFGISGELSREVIDNPNRFQASMSAEEANQLMERYVQKLKEGNLPGVNENRLEEAVLKVLACYLPGIEQLSKRNAERGADTDLRAKLPGTTRVCVQVKCYQEKHGKLGVAAVEQLRKSMEPGDKGLIVTTNTADKEATALAEQSPETPIEIIDVNGFAQLVFDNTDKLTGDDLRLLGLTLDVR